VNRAAGKTTLPTIHCKWKWSASVKEVTNLIQTFQVIDPKQLDQNTGTPV
jgi:hypothetical protein